MEEQELKSKEEAQKILVEMNQKFELDRIEELLKDNKVDFKHKEKEYQVRLLTMRDKEELDDLRRKKFTNLLKDKDVLFEKDLIRIYKEKGIDIEEIMNNMKKYESERFGLQMKLGEALSKKAEEPILKGYEEEIKVLDQKINVLMIQKSDLLMYSFENQLMNSVAKWISYLSLYIKENDKYIKAFKTLEDFNVCDDEGLIGMATKYALMLQYL